MKVDYNGYGSFELKAEDGRDELFLAEYLKSIPNEYRSVLSNFIRVDMDSMCVTDKDPDTGKKLPNGETMKMEDCDIGAVFDRANRKETWGPIVSLAFNSEYYMQDEMVKRIEKLLKYLKKK